MKNNFCCCLLLIGLAFLSGCAASEAAQEDQKDTALKNNQKAPTAHPTGMGTAARMISPIVN